MDKIYKGIPGAVFDRNAGRYKVPCDALVKVNITLGYVFSARLNLKSSCTTRDCDKIA